jgi:uncharacterized protein (DUF2235 family)
MKKLIVSCDGTWNTADQTDNEVPSPTNVVRLHNCLAAAAVDGTEQLKYYHPGVGTEGNAFQRALGGAVGLGLDKNIMGAYHWLARNYAAGDQIFLFGFSRGAYTARSLAGFIGRCGLLSLGNLSPTESWARVESAYTKGYRKRDAAWRDSAWAVEQPKVDFLGVWDTVGSLGLPDDFALLNLLDKAKNWSFHDTTLGAHILKARHAVAMDEMRASFTPTLWTDENDHILNDPDDSGRVRQVWFPGVHSDVGGGYVECGLSDLALDWMIKQAELSGLAFDPAFKKQIRPDFQGLLHDSLRGAFKAMRSRPRNRPLLLETAAYHDSAPLRDREPPVTQSPYHQPSVRLQVGESSAPIPIYARNHWNETGLFLEEGASYTFKADGQWLDGNVPCGPGGSKDGKFKLGELVNVASSLFGKLEGAFKKVTGNEQADFIGTRRSEQHPWLSLLGAIANDGPQHGTNPNGDGSPYPHQSFFIGEGSQQPLLIKPTEAGYLYAFANDAWHFYGNNRGSVNLTVTRVS